MYIFHVLFTFFNLLHLDYINRLIFYSILIFFNWWIFLICGISYWRKLAILFYLILLIIIIFYIRNTLLILKFIKTVIKFNAILIFNEFIIYLWIIIFVLLLQHFQNFLLPPLLLKCFSFLIICDRGIWDLLL